MAAKPSPVVRDASSLIKARHRAGRRRRAVRIVIAVLVLALAAGAVWAVWFSPWFVTRSVQVTGTTVTTPEEIAAAAGVKPGTPLIRLDVAAIRDAVGQVPAVASAEVRWNLDGVVLIAVTERVAVYVIPESGQYRLVDVTGTGYLTLPEAPKGLPVVRLADDGSDVSKRLMADAGVIAAALPQSVRDKMVSMTAGTPDTFTIDLKGGAQILWGSAEQSALKAQVIDGLLKVSAHYYDISSPSHPATR